MHNGVYPRVLHADEYRVASFTSLSLSLALETEMLLLDQSSLSG